MHPYACDRMALIRISHTNLVRGSDIHDVLCLYERSEKKGKKPRITSQVRGHNKIISFLFEKVLNSMDDTYKQVNHTQCIVLVTRLPGLE